MLSSRNIAADLDIMYHITLFMGRINTLSLWEIKDSSGLRILSQNSYLKSDSLAYSEVMSMHTIHCADLPWCESYFPSTGWGRAWFSTWNMNLFDSSVCQGIRCLLYRCSTQSQLTNSAEWPAIKQIHCLKQLTWEASRMQWVIIDESETKWSFHWVLAVILNQFNDEEDIQQRRERKDKPQRKGDKEK